MSLPKTRAATDDMDIDPEDDMLNYGMSDDETSLVNTTSLETPVAEVITTIEDPSLSTSLEQGGTSNLNEEMPLAEEQPNPISGLVTRQEAGSLGVIDLIATCRPTEFLVVTGAPVMEVTWADYLAIMAHLIEDGSLYEGQFIQVVWTLQKGEQLFWMQSPSDRATIAGRGYLSARQTINGVMLNCFTWALGDAEQTFGPLLSDMAVDKGVVNNEPQVPLKQQLSSGPSSSLLSRLQIPKAPSPADRPGGAGSSTLEIEDITDLDIGEEEDMEELPENKHHPWKAHRKRAAKKHRKMYPGEFLLKAPP
ncbi:hypothetical protein DXG01_006496 [Tephrocybe rancida]|nr:hypothetical protein DXG01_006496 [Tephrocybe rancida]